MADFTPTFEGDLPEHLRKALKNIVDSYDLEEKYVRERQLRELKRADNFWHGIQYSIWDEAVGDFRSPNAIFESQIEQDVNPNIFSKIKNIYKAHGESTIAALTAGIPYVRFFPNNAEDANDVQTAKAYSKIEELIQRHNKAQLIFIHSLFILFNQNFVAAYNYQHQDKKYGTRQVPVQGVVPVTNTIATCPECNAVIDETQVEGAPQEIPQETTIPEAGPESLNVENGDPNLAANSPEVAAQQAAPQAAPTVVCPSCGATVEPFVESTQSSVPSIIRYDSIDKTRECVEVYGPLNVVLPHYVKRQKDTPFIGLDGEIHVALAREYWPQIQNEVEGNSDQTKYDTWSRTPNSYAGDAPRGLVTVRRRWLRPWAFNILQKQQTADEVQELKTLFPDGCYCVFVNDEFAEAQPEGLDEHWTVTYSPLSNYLHADPIGSPLLPIQEVVNELLNLNIQSIQYGIPETFADPEVLDFNQYQKVESGPGLVFPAKPQTGKGLGDAFYSNKVAVLSKEAMGFSESLNQDAQFVSGSFPSIYGGPQSGGGQTAAEYSMSRAQALQRLGLTWKILSQWWAEVMGKSVASFANSMVEDENFVKRQGDSYVNVWIRKVELEGTVGEVEPDVDEQFPVSWAQKREVLLDLIKLQSDGVNEFLFYPANRAQIATLVGLTDLEVPGVLDVNKQLAEIMEMLQAEAVPPPLDENGQPQIGPDGMPMQGMSSVQIDEDLDDDEMHADTCKNWMNGDVGMELKKKAPAIYMNIFLHFKAHVMRIQAKAAAQQQQELAMQQAGAEHASGLKQQENASKNQNKG